MNNQDTIIAPATAVGDSGVAIVRISGSDALLFLHEYFKPAGHVTRFFSHQLYFGRLYNADAEVIDEVMAVFMQPPRTYTAEPVVEIHCHGSRQIVKNILALAVSFGIRLAGPGEFTYRAFLNGRLDLTQAEAVSRLIHAKSEGSRKAALHQLDGFLSRQIHVYSETIKQLIAQLEAWIDFPEEDIPQKSNEDLAAQAATLLSDMLSLAGTYSVGQIVHEGATVVLVGLPNVGKSSLLNALLGRERAIVSASPGTTRDLIEESLDVDGMTVRLVDTAGLRDTDDYVEREGVRRTQAKLETADLVLLLLDSTAAPDENFLKLVRLCEPYTTFLVLTKSDIVSHPFATDFFSGPVCRVSARERSGLEPLKKLISSILLNNYVSDAEPAFISERRHYEALILAVESLQRFHDGINFTPFDLLAIDLRDALDYLGLITGRVSTDAILDDIFSRFCIGK